MPEVPAQGHDVSPEEAANQAAIQAAQTGELGQDLAATPELPDGLSDTAAASHPKNLDEAIRQDAGEEASRWDYNKAYAMSDVMRKNKSIDLDRRQAAVQHMREMRPESEKLFSDVKSEYQEAKIKAQKALEMGFAHPNSKLARSRASKLGDRRDSLQSYLGSYVEPNAAKYSEGREKYFQEQDDNKMDLQMSTAVELYDVNPEKFATMPTKDFMELVKQLDGETYAVNFAREVNKGLDKTIDSLKGARENKISLSLDDCKLIIGSVSVNVGVQIDPRRIIEELADNWYERSPKQVAEEMSKLVDGLSKTTSDEIERAVNARQALLDRFKPQPEEPEAA